MNIKPQPPTSVRGALLKGTRSALLLFVPGAAVLAVAASQPIPMTFVPPEDSQSAVVQTKAEKQAERAMAKCEALPVGTLPSGAVIQWTDERGTRYTEDPGTVSMAFDIAVGALELPENSRVGGFELCL